MWYPPPPRDRLCLGRLRRGRYASCGFPQEDFLVKQLSRSLTGGGTMFFSAMCIFVRSRSAHASKVARACFLLSGNLNLITYKRQIIHVQIIKMSSCQLTHIPLQIVNNAIHVSFCTYAKSWNCSSKKSTMSMSFCLIARSVALLMPTLQC